MKLNRLFKIGAIALAFTGFTCGLASVNAQTDVVAFWDFDADYDFRDDLEALEMLVEVPAGRFSLSPGTNDDNTVSGNASLEVFLGEPGELDGNGGGGFTGYTSPISGAEANINPVGPSRTIKWDDLSGGGPVFDINGVDEFDIDANDGMGVQQDDFGNDALVYITLDATGFTDLQVRFDIEGTPGLDPLDPTASDLPTSFDLFYRTGGSGTWFRDANQNNINIAPLFVDHNPVDPDNQFADSGFHALNSALDNQSMVEIIISDFNEFGNNELELDNIEIVANTVPEPTAIGLILFGGLCLLGMRRRKR